MTDFNSYQYREQAPVQSVPDEKPASITVFGVLNCVFGGLALLCFPVGIFGMIMAHRTMEICKGYMIFLSLSYVASLGFSIWLLALGIGLLKFKGWARRGSVIYASIAIVWGIAGLGLNFLALSLGWIIPPDNGLPGYIGGLCGGILGMIYPILLLIFMGTAKVKEAFRAIGG